MIEMINNPNNLDIKDIDMVSNKVRAIIVNDFDIIIVNYNDNLMLPGGKIEINEEAKEALKRELNEELGLDIDTRYLIPFIEYHNYLYEYPSRYGNNLNKLVKTEYYILKTDKDINLDNNNLSENEKKSKFEIIKESLLFVDPMIESFSSNNPRYPYFKKELIDVCNLFGRYYVRDYLKNSWRFVTSRVDKCEDKKKAKDLLVKIKEKSNEKR